MDRFNDNNATPTKRTGPKSDNSYKDSENNTGRDNDRSANTGIIPEIPYPNPTSATPSIPSEMPAREMK